MQPFFVKREFCEALDRAGRISQDAKSEKPISHEFTRMSVNLRG